MSAETPIGGLADRVTLRRRMSSDEAEGGIAVSFVTLGIVWARVRALGARQSLAGDARSAEISHVVVLRRRNDLTPGDRIVWAGGTLRIDGIGLLDTDRAYIGCQCTATEVTG